MFNAVQESEQSLAMKVANQISKLIQDKQLNVGERLPNEFELATELNVGRGTVREAVKLLVARNVLVIKRGKGTFVAKHPGVADDPLGFSYVQDKMKLAEDLLEVRTLIEPWVASTASMQATQEDIAFIRSQCEVVEQQILQHIPHGQEDIRFHTAIAKATRNVVVPSLIPVINQSVELLTQITNWSLAEETIKTHRDILDAIIAHDSEAAAAAMQLHLHHNRERLKKLRREQH